MKIQFPDYQNCIANLPNSILRGFGIEAGGATLKLSDPYMAKDYENIVVLLLDGMGKCIMDQNLSKDGFFHSNLAGTYSSLIWTRPQIKLRSGLLTIPTH